MSFNGQKLIPSITVTKPNNTAPLYIVDAFASGPFTGNPAAVCLLESSVAAGWMQSVAAPKWKPKPLFHVTRGVATQGVATHPLAPYFLSLGVLHQ